MGFPWHSPNESQSQQKRRNMTKKVGIVGLGNYYLLHPYTIEQELEYQCMYMYTCDTICIQVTKFKFCQYCTN